ncbi:MAG: gliding motility-associated ABC transporter ATP-binding subunit GldA [Saprospiraceae bacterium]|jgi:ABC-2 type transport system ATP-binding protein|nr:gliding motility-associated ABC transporter ATP-binding subunit GldA [Candidatus Parvibacillus calidus]MBX2936220.1 gliding motility-associated ABC transporter ATP-binding subunit GldA [Saprospiraceae bacterium]MBX7178342.1 gliding motility-associated ABC transporter ATP-binding subunit GldA [Saprospiraceae bacterium]MCB0591597.1 gliding motility-associated ABC transporter ATP-binding subunit GldA [Saprospiraceae bacterium]MCO5283284.1 gliding motility-associated ABC transporter ATP-binding 
MSVEVNNLTKIYGTQKALDNVSFSVSEGDILGFLGPNGAGKSTTMKILSCFIPQTSGEATIGGKNVKSESLEVRRLVGYLPEHNPLYKDMYIKEYLLYIAKLYGIARPFNRVKDMIELTGLGREQKKLISQISKGYRQRVGLAQAMIHNPEVLIMDEPTSGLDPNQLMEIRNVIREIGKEKIVIFSTHIMQEVEALCNRVIIINKGKIVLDDNTEKLQTVSKGSTTVMVQFVSPGKIDTTRFKHIKGLKDIKHTENNVFEFTSERDSDIREQIFDSCVSAGYKIIRMEHRQFSMEDIFQQLTLKS